MEVGTGYFAKAMKYHTMGYVQVCISRKMPWFVPVAVPMYHYVEVAPTDEILALKDKPNEYTARYEAEVLSRVNRSVFVAYLKDLCKDTKKDKVALMCYEAPDKFCHRHIVARWLNEIGLNVGEIETVDTKGMLFEGI